MAKHTDQVHLLPAADATLIGVAVGMAIGGYRPVVELAGTTALWGAVQQLGQEAAAIGGEFSAPVVVRVPVGAEGFDPTPLLTAVTGLTVACGSTPSDAASLLQAATDQLTKCAALDLAKDAIRVNAVNPGVVITELQKTGVGAAKS